MVVVLPAPFAPRKPKTSPWPTSNVKRSSAVVLPNRLVTWSISRLTTPRIAAFPPSHVRAIGHGPAVEHARRTDEGVRSVR